MEKTVQPISAVVVPKWTLAEVAQMVGGQVEGPADLVVAGVTSADSINSDGIAFAESDHYVNQAKAAGIRALLLPADLDSQGIPAVRVAVPRKAFLMLLHIARRPWPLGSGVHPSAVVDPQAEVDPSASIGPFAVVERFAKVSAGARVYPFAYIGEACCVGEGSVIGPHVVLTQAVSIGAGTTIQPGAVLGADGFGYVWDGSQHLKIPQVGTVVVGDHVEIGALTAIDRATSGDTTIGEGSRLDNLIQVGHNTRIGRNTVIAALTGISGSTTIGSNVAMGGQCATVDHVTIGDNISFAGRSAAIGDVLEPGEYFGAPARPIREGMRNMLLVTKLSDLFSRLRKVEKRVEELADPTNDGLKN